MPLLPIIGHITSDDPEVQVQLPMLVVKSQVADSNTHPSKSHATAAAGSKSQLPRVEKELKEEPMKHPIAHSTTLIMAEPANMKCKSYMKDLPFSVRLIRLSEKTIQKYTSNSSTSAMSSSATLYPGTTSTTTITLTHKAGPEPTPCGVVSATKQIDDQYSSKIKSFSIKLWKLCLLPNQ